MPRRIGDKKKRGTEKADREGPPEIQEANRERTKTLFQGGNAVNGV